MKQRTEEEMLNLLRKKYTVAQGNGPAYAFVPHVRNDAGFAATRTLDAMAMSLWPSRGLYLWGFEIKCSRSDWLSELKDPSKAEAFIPYLDYFCMVVSSRDIIKAGELPEGWGLLAPHGPGLSYEVVPTRNESPLEIDRGMLAALLRQAGLEAASEPALDAARRAGYVAGQVAQKNVDELDLAAARRAGEHARDREAEVCEIIGRPDLLSVFRSAPERFGNAVKAVLDADRDQERIRSRLQRLGSDAKVLSEQVDRILNEHDIEAIDL